MYLIETLISEGCISLQVTRLMARFNKIEVDEEFWKKAECLSTKVKYYCFTEKKNYSQSSTTFLSLQKPDDISSGYSTIDLFRSGVIRLLTLKVAFSWYV